MSFHLRIATQRDPVERAPALRLDTGELALRAARVATLEVNGELSAQSIDELCGQAAAILETDAGTVVIELQAIDGGGEKALMAPLAAWVAEQRSAGHQVYVWPSQPHVHDLLVTMPDAKAWLIARTSCDTSLSRRTIHIDGPASRMGET